MRACDPQRLARAQHQWSGVIEVGTLERFASALVGAEKPVNWQARFSMEPGADGEASAWLTLEYLAHTKIACGLCAEPLDLLIDEKRRFSFAADEEDASRLDEQADDHDVIVAEPSFDLLDLIEDELILALPVHAQHEECPTDSQDGNGMAGLASTDGAAGVQQTQRPFADLGNQMKAVNKSGGQSGGQSSQGLRDGGSGAEPDAEPNGGS